MQLITIDVKRKTFDISAVEGSSGSIQIFFDNVPAEWQEDTLGVYALFSKGSKGELYRVDKNTMMCSVPNSMVSENSGFKVTVFAMNSDTENPYRYVLHPIWVEVSEGYECSVVSGMDKDNMDAVCTLIQTLMGYEEAEGDRVEAEQGRMESEERRNKIINALPPTDLAYSAQSENPQSGIAVAQAIAAIVDSAPETLNTLEELAKALGNDPNFATTIMELIGKKVDNTSYTEQLNLIKEIINSKVDSDDFEEITDTLSASLFEAHEKADNNALNIGDMEALSKHTLVEAINSVLDLVYNRENFITDYINEQLATKVSKVDGKGLSSNDFTDDEKSDLAEVVEHAISLEENKADAFALEAHTSNTDNPHSVTKSQIGLENADNTSDMDKPISRAMQEAFDSINEAIEQISGIVADKSDKADKLSGYGITDAYTKDEVITLINNAIGEALEADY